VLPFFIFGPRLARLVALAGFSGLMLLILLTGNYCFFNLITLALALSLADDGQVPKHWRERLGLSSPAAPRRIDRYTARAHVPLALVISLISASRLAMTMRESRLVPAPLVKLDELVEPFRSVNNYGLYAVMTTTRPEIQVEGSND